MGSRGRWKATQKPSSTQIAGRKKYNTSAPARRHGSRLVLFTGRTTVRSPGCRGSEDRSTTAMLPPMEVSANG